MPSKANAGKVTQCHLSKKWKAGKAISSVPMSPLNAKNMTAVVPTSTLSFLRPKNSAPTIAAAVGATTKPRNFLLMVLTPPLCREQRRFAGASRNQ
jgi:hypothetical protein